MRNTDIIIEVEKFNPYHDRLGRFTTAGGGASLQSGPIKTDKYKDLIPANSYINSGEYKKAQNEAKVARGRHNALEEERKYLEEELKKESSPKPKSQWTEEDKYNAIMRNRPMNYTERGEQLKKRLDEVTSESIKASNDMNAAMKKMEAIKEENHNKQVAEHEYKMPAKATQAEYKGFKTDDTGTSHGNDLLRRGYLAEMSPKEYLERCAYEIFEGATIESTIMGTESANVAKYTKMMQNGVKFDTPYLDYIGEGQEGRHRAIAAYNLGIEKIPVVIRDNRLDNAQTMKQKKTGAFNRFDEIETL